MKRPEFITIYSPINNKRKDICVTILNFLEQFWSQPKSFITPYYAKVGYDTENCHFKLVDERMNLSDRHDLLERLDRDRNCMWCCRVNLKFGTSDIEIVIFSDDVHHKSDITVIITMEPIITDYLEREEYPRLPCILFLIKISELIGANWFLSGLNLYKWNPLTLEKFTNRKQFEHSYYQGSSPYVIAWKNNILNEEDLLEKWNSKIEDVIHSTLNYKFISFFPVPM